MGEFFKDKPSSRVLRPPGGGSSNIFGGSDQTNGTSKHAATKPTFQSSVFSTEPEPVKAKPTNRPSVTSSSIFDTEPEDNGQNSPRKAVSKTHQSSVFQDSEPLSSTKPEMPISNIPMFTTHGPVEVRRPNRRPITAPSLISSCFSSESSIDVRNPVGQRRKVNAGYRPANANFRSTVFNAPENDPLLGRKHFAEQCAIGQTVSFTGCPIAEGDSAAESVPDCRPRQSQRSVCSKTYLSVAFSQPEEGFESKVYSSNGAVLNFSKKVSGTNNESTVFGEDCSGAATPDVEAAPLSEPVVNDNMRSTVFSQDESFESDDPVVTNTMRSTVFNQDEDLKSNADLWSAGGVPRRRCEKTGSVEAQKSTVFDEFDPSSLPLYSSGFSMTPRRAKNCAARSGSSLSNVFTHCSSSWPELTVQADEIKHPPVPPVDQS